MKHFFSVYKQLFVLWRRRIQVEVGCSDINSHNTCLALRNICTSFRATESRCRLVHLDSWAEMFTGNKLAGKLQKETLAVKVVSIATELYFPDAEVAHLLPKIYFLKKKKKETILFFLSSKLPNHLRQKVETDTFICKQIKTK